MSTSPKIPDDLDAAFEKRYRGRDTLAEVRANAAAYEARKARTDPSPRARTTVGEVLRSRDRFDRARALAESGREDEARRVWWWPRLKPFPRSHYSEMMPAPCYCGKKSPDGLLALCAYCGGLTPETPVVPPRAT